MASAGGAGAAHAYDYDGAAFSTRVIHIGSTPDAVTGAVVPAISMSTTFAQPSPGMAPGKDSHLSYGKGFEYSRTSNPTRNCFEQALAAAERAKHGFAFASGLAATVTLLHTLKAGDHVVCIDDVYGGTQRYFRRIASEMGITFDFVDFTVDGALAGAMKPNTKLVWMETPTNPTLKISDIAAAAATAHAGGAILVVDNTFMSPFFQNPLTLGADVVMHSVTKYINGHSDVVMGALATNSDELATRLRFLQNSLGAIPSPMDCYLAHRGLKTLHVRMERHASNAMAVASMLEAHPAVEKVLYPGLASHPQHAIAAKQMRGFGGMITFYVKGGLAGARAFLENVKLFTCAESLGAVESLAESPAIMTHASVPAEVRASLGISDSLVRLSVGIEAVDDLLGDLRQALEKSAAAVVAAGGVGSA